MTADNDQIRRPDMRITLDSMHVSDALIQRLPRGEKVTFGGESSRPLPEICAVSWDRTVRFKGDRTDEGAEGLLI